jgi:hypothetical protein
MWLGKDYCRGILLSDPLHATMHGYDFVHDIVNDDVDCVTFVERTLDEQHVSSV